MKAEGNTGMGRKMRVKRTVTITLAVFLLCAVLCGTVSAFMVTSPGTTNPSGAVVPNETVTGHMQILIKHDTLTDGDKIYFESDLINPSWSVSVGTQGGVPLLTKTPQAPVNYITGYDVSYGDSDIVVDINVTGTVFSGSAGTEITAMTVRATASETTGVKSASSAVQMVYDAGSISDEISALNVSIQNLDERIAVYTGYGWDVSDAQNALEQARSKVSEAESISDLKSKYDAINTAKTLLMNAERKLALASLSMSLTYITYVDTIVQELYQKGWNSEAMLLDTKNTNLKNTHNQLVAIYMAGPNPGSADILAADSLALYNEALGYLNSSDNQIRLCSGWNFISVPKKLAAAYDTAAELFNGVNSGTTSGLSYDAANKRWDLITGTTPITPLNAYWIYSTETKVLDLEFDTAPSVPAVMTVSKGWNAVGVSAEHSLSANSAFNGVNWRTFLLWDAENQKTGIVCNKGGSGAYSDEQQIPLYKGGWLYVNEPGTLIGYA